MRWTTRIFGKDHRSNFFVACWCFLQLGQYLKQKPLLSGEAGSQGARATWAHKHGGDPVIFIFQARGGVPDTVLGPRTQKGAEQGLEEQRSLHPASPGTRKTSNICSQ